VRRAEREGAHYTREMGARVEHGSPTEMSAPMHKL
jgi:hypothetical protein